MLQILSLLKESLLNLMSPIFGSQTLIGKAFISMTSGIGSWATDLIIVCLALLIVPALGVMANVSWGRNTFRKMYGEIEGIELRKFMILAFSFGLLICAYWSMRTVRDGFFNHVVGIDYLPRVKILSVFVFSAIMMIFSKVVDRFKKHHLFFVVCACYSIIFVAVSLFDWFELPVVSVFPFNLVPGRMIGWIYYLAVDSLGGILAAAVFWAFVVSTTTTRLAKQGFPIIFIGGQIGGVVGVTFVKNFVQKLGHPITILATAVPLILLPLAIEFLVMTTPKELMISDQGTGADTEIRKSKPGFVEGLRLLATQPYLIGITVISTIYEVVGAIVEFQFKRTAATVYSGAHLTSYYATYGQALLVMSLLFAVFGTSFFVRTFGVRACLVSYPLIVGFCVLSIMAKPELGIFFVAAISIKAFSYTLNSPIKELLYLPTSKDVKYKAKGFIEGLGQKAAKASGSTVNEVILGVSKGSKDALLNFGGLISLGVIGFWLFVAVALGRAYQKLIAKNEIIE